MKKKLNLPQLPWLEGLAAFFYPPICEICESNRATPVEGYVCESCRGAPGAIELIKPPFCHRCGLPYDGAITNEFICSNCKKMVFYFESARSAVKMSGVVLEAIHRFKYNKALWFEPFLVDLFFSGVEHYCSPADWDWIVPVPLHSVKEREREFNQSARLASALSLRCGIPVNQRLLKRHVATATQTKLSRKARYSNMKNAFSLRKNVNLDGKRIIILDDVFTTGSTTNACAEVLKKAGAHRLVVWTLARGL